VGNGVSLAIAMLPMKLDPLDSLIIAGLLVDEHGQGALAVALRRAADAVAADDTAAFLAWCTVATAAARFLDSDTSRGDAETEEPH
jgi:hypothetical protein